MTLPSIPPPPDAPLAPDSATRKGPDFTGGADAEGRVFKLNIGFMHYGTDDRTVATAILLFFVLIAFGALLALFASWSSNEIFKAVFSWLPNLLFIVVGVAVGRALPNYTRHD